MKILSMLLLGITLTTSLPASNIHSLELEINQFVSRLNSKFDLDVTIRKVQRCGFSSHQNEDNGIFEIRFCNKDLKFFNDLPSSENPVSSLLTIIAHEYAHFLLDYDYSDDAIRVFEDSLEKNANEILRAIRNNEGLLRKLKAIYSKLETESRRGDIPEDEKYLRAIYHVLLLASHENVDSLGIKLMHLINYKSNPQVMKYFPALIGMSGPLIEDMVQTRTFVLKISEEDSLVSWSNYQCIAQGTERTDYGPKLKKVFSEAGYTSLLSLFNQPCPADQINKTFYRLLNNYYSRLK